MTTLPSSTGFADIADLLEREEKLAKDRVRKEKQQQQRTEAIDSDPPIKQEDVYIKMEDGDVKMEDGDVKMEDRPVKLEHQPSASVELPVRDARRLSRPSDDDFNDRTGRAGLRTSKDRYLSEREENDERRARRSRDHADDGAANGGSDKDSANGSVRSRRRSRSPRPDIRRNHRSRERGDYWRGGGRRSSFDCEDDGRHYRPGGDRRGDLPLRPRSRDRGGRDRGGRDDRDRGPRAGRDRGGRDANRRSPFGNKRKTPEPTDDERDRRTVFVQQLAARLRSRELKEFFEQAGSVVDAQIVKDRVSGRSKGVGYVEFREEESVQKAIQLTGQKLLGIPIIAQLTEAEKNRQARNTEGVATQSNGIPFHRLYVGNIHFSITEEDLRLVFEPFGELEFVQLQKEDAGRSKGYGFVQYIDPKKAKEALEKMNGFELAHRPIRVGLGNDKFTPESTQSLLQRFGNQPQGSLFSGAGGRGAHAGGSNNFDHPAPRDVDKTGGASALDDTDVGGLNMSNYNRDALMRKLARHDGPAQTTAPRALQKRPVVVQPTASRCVILKNMYDQNEESDPKWQEELKEDVKNECDDKYGRVVHVGLALDNNDGEVYIKFDRVQGGENAIRGLNGRYFGGKMITAQYVVDAVYHMNFPRAQNL